MKAKISETEKEQIMAKVSQLKKGDFVIVYDFTYNAETNRFLGLQKREIFKVTPMQFSFIHSNGKESCRMAKSRFIDGSDLAKLI